MKAMVEAKNKGSNGIIITDENAAYDTKWPGSYGSFPRGGRLCFGCDISDRPPQS